MIARRLRSVKRQRAGTQRKGLTGSCPGPTSGLARAHAVPKGGRGNGDAARFNRLPRPARRQGWSGQAEVVPRPESLPWTKTNAGPEPSRVADCNPAIVGCMPSPGNNLLRSDRPRHPGGFFGAPCTPVLLSPSTRERLLLHWSQIGICMVFSMIGLLLASTPCWKSTRVHDPVGIVSSGSIWSWPTGTERGGFRSPVV